MAFNSFPAKGGIPSGTTAARPASPAVGDTYYDGTLGFLLIFDGTSFIPCSAPAAQPTIVVTDVGTSVAYGTVQGSLAFTEGVSGGKAAGFTGVQGNFSTTSVSSPLVVTITGNPGSYSFNGTAYNGFGTSPSSLSVSQTLTSLPETPTIGTATASTSANEVTVTWTLGATGGKNLSAITITPYLNGTTAETTRTAATTSSASYTFTSGQLTGAASYTFKVSKTNANGTSVQSNATNSATMPNFITVNYLVVAGGGGGAGGVADQGGGGGGAGGLRSSVTASGGSPGTAESSLLLTKSTNYTATVGAGGAGGANNTTGSNGNNSVLSTITSTAGGAGAKQDVSANSGGSGGGAGSGGAVTSGGAGTANQGFAGGNNTSSPYHAAGGGGASAVGGNGGAGTGPGGNGVAVSITGSSVTYGGGGGGGTHDANRTTGTGGTGGGGASGAFQHNPGNAGTANLGGSGGGGSGNGAGGSGGAGVVILRYLTSEGTITIGAGLTGTTATDGSHKVTTITAGTGNVSWA